ncbi:MAG TPA: Ni/Fe-hydrogenase, b-type cytochrome subunit [Syntrophomonadaceae bacterium]|nr:Ni/Fe-hydrogenase, b-type cytochrome subunit [Syntrophomonadaceae bacterium]
MVKVMEDRHSIWIRIFHWINMIAITMLTLTGFYIHAPQAFRLFSSMDVARTIHFAMAYVLIFGVVGRVYYACFDSEWKNIVYSPVKDTLKLPSMLKYYAFLADDHPFYGKYNPGQKGMYTGVLVMAILQVITGFIMYKPAMFLGLSGWFFGFMTVRIIHYAITWILVLCVLFHVYLDMAEGLPILKSMFTGKINADFHHGYHEDEA